MVKMKNYCPEVRKFKQIISSDGGTQRQVCPQGPCIPALSHQTQPHSRWKLEFQQRRHTGARWGPALWCWQLDWTRAGTCAEGLLKRQAQENTFSQGNKLRLEIAHC